MNAFIQAIWSIRLPVINWDSVTGTTNPQRPSHMQSSIYLHWNYLCRRVCWLDWLFHEQSVCLVWSQKYGWCDHSPADLMSLTFYFRLIFYLKLTWVTILEGLENSYVSCLWIRKQQNWMLPDAMNLFKYSHQSGLDPVDVAGHCCVRMAMACPAAYSISDQTHEWLHACTYVYILYVHPLEGDLI